MSALPTIIKVPFREWCRSRSLTTIRFANESPPPIPPHSGNDGDDGDPDDCDHPYPYFTCPMCRSKGATLVDGDDGPEFLCLDCTRPTLPFPPPPTPTRRAI